jgi:hypothetical protein
MSPTAWSIEYQVREDAESMFVPAELLPGAQTGDVVEITSVQPPVRRRGRVAGPVITDSAGDFITVTLDDAIAVEG